MDELRELAIRALLRQLRRTLGVNIGGFYHDDGSTALSARLGEVTYKDKHLHGDEGHRLELQLTGLREVIQDERGRPVGEPEVVVASKLKRILDEDLPEDLKKPLLLKGIDRYVDDLLAYLRPKIASIDTEAMRGHAAAAKRAKELEIELFGDDTDRKRAAVDRAVPGRRPAKRTRSKRPDGTEEVTHPDGTVTALRDDGTKEVTPPGGATMEIPPPASDDPAW